MTVTTVSAAELDADRVERQVDVVVHDDDVLNVDVIELHEVGNRATRVVHVCAGFSENDFWATETNSAFGYRGVCLVRFETRRNAIGQNV